MRKRDLQSKSAIQAAVREVADEYLSGPNINSADIGYKVEDGRKTDELAPQFTAGTRFVPEALEARRRRDPSWRETISAYGISFTTDDIERKIERKFDPHPVAVAREAISTLAGEWGASCTLGDVPELCSPLRAMRREDARTKNAYDDLQLSLRRTLSMASRQTERALRLDRSVGCRCRVERGVGDAQG